jgi:hypothetical protein
MSFMWMEESSDQITRGDLMYFPECVDCTKHHGFDVVFTISCFLNGHERLWIDMDDDEVKE